MKLRGIKIGVVVLLVLAVAAAGFIYVKGTLPKSVIYILPESGFDSYEFTKSKGMLEERDYKVVLASTVKGELKDDRNKKYQCDLLVKDVDLADYKMVILVGGDGTKLILQNEEIHALLRKADEKGMNIAAICYAPMVLANAGVLKGEEATVYPSHDKELEEQGGIYKNESVVVSNNFITAQGPGDTKAFAEKMLEVLKGK